MLNNLYLELYRIFLSTMIQSSAAITMRELGFNQIYGFGLRSVKTAWTKILLEDMNEEQRM